MVKTNSIFAVVVTAVVAALVGVFLYPRISIPTHLSNHAAVVELDLVPLDTATYLIRLMKELGEYHSNVNQAKGQGYAPTHEHIGEAIPINPDGTCSHPLLYPNNDQTMCILPERFDIGKHFVMTGGLDGSKENFQELVDRVSSFGRYMFSRNMEDYPIVKSLFESEKFVAASKKICPSDAPYLDPFQFNFIVQVPGQTVATHIDSPYFWGASRYHFPQWLLACMCFSGLYKDLFVHQVQVVAYLHDWEMSANSTEKSAKGGEFIYFINDTMTEAIEPISLSGSFIDGSKVLHAAKVYQPGIKAPHMDKDKVTVLKFTGDNNWEVQSDGKTIQKYKTSDLRLSLVYRAKCFATPEDADRYSKLKPEDMLSLESVLEKLSMELVKRKKISSAKIKSMSRLDLAFFLVDSYITYPLPDIKTALIPYNYCALSKLFPWMSYILSTVCN